MRKVGIAIILALAAAVLAFAWWPLAQPAMVDTSAITAEDEQESFLRQLELGQTYEQAGQVNEAQALYAQAALAEQAEIAAAARAGLARVTQQQNNRILLLQTAVRGWLIWLLQNVTLLLLAAAFVWLIWQAVGRLRQRSGYLLLPLTDYTADAQANGFHELVQYYLQQAVRTHRSHHDALLAPSEHLDLPLFSTDAQDSLAASLSSLDTFAAGGVNLPLGKIILFFQPWLSQYAYTVGGSLHQQGETLRLRVVVKHTTSQQVKHSWELSGPADQPAALAEELAYRLVYRLCQDLEARQWRSFFLFTTALRSYRQYGAESTSLEPVRHACTALSEALMLDPGYTTASFWQGVVCSTLGQLRQARDAFREVTVKEEHPLALPARYNLALAFYHEFQEWANEKAIAELRQVEQALAQPELDDTQQRLLALTHTGLAAAEAQRILPWKKEDSEALAHVESHCRRALDLAGEREEVRTAVHYARGMAFARAGKRDEAVTELTAAARMRPDYVTACVQLARLVEKQSVDEAVQWLEQALHWRPDYAYAHLQLGILLAQQGDTEAAKAAYRRGAGLPDAHNRLGELLAQEGYYEEALQEFEQAVQLKRNHARAWGNRAWWTVESGEQDTRKLANALQWARRAQQLNSGTQYEWFSHLAIGRIYLAQNKLNEAATAFEKSIELEENQIQNRYYLACLYAEKEDWQKAMDTLTAALSLSEGSIWRDKAVALIKDVRAQIAGEGEQA